MKAINHASVVKGYLRFSVCMAAAVFLFMLMSHCFISTSVFESSKIEARAVAFDRTFSTQIHLVDQMDSLYNYMLFINSSNRLNDVMIQNMISTQKMRLLEELNSLEEKDIMLYKNLVVKVNDFLTIKDSIRILRSREEALKEDLQRCISSERQASRKLAIENVPTAKMNK